jgi:tRNA pseudouridine38-40 synthase
MPTFKITVAYDGTDYVGWQRQATGTSIQGLLEDALRAIEERDVAAAGAGRTDAGVHALGQVVSFTLARLLPCDTIVRALNARLPDAVRVVAAEEAPDGFHARFDARAKTYRYRIWTGPVLPPFERRYAWHVTGALDVAAMCRAARAIEGEHDFAAFQSAGSEAATSVRRIFASRIADCGLRIDCGAGIGGLWIDCGLRNAGLRSDCGLVESRGDDDLSTIDQSAIRNPQSSNQSAIRNPQSALLIYEIAADGFLRHMVRAIVGTLVEIGRGARSAESITAVLASADRAAAGRTAPARGLFLARVDYDETR